MMLILVGIALHVSRLPDLCILIIIPLAWISLRQTSKALPMTLVLRADGSAAQIDSAGHPQSVQILNLHERGPLGVLVLEVHGRKMNLPWMGDSLKRSVRRDLRLWIGDHVRAVAPVAASSSPNSPSPE